MTGLTLFQSFLILVFVLAGYYSWLVVRMFTVIGFHTDVSPKEIADTIKGAK